MSNEEKIKKNKFERIRQNKCFRRHFRYLNDEFIESARFSKGECRICVQNLRKKRHVERDI